MAPDWLGQVRHVLAPLRDSLDYRTLLVTAATVGVSYIVMATVTSFRRRRRRPPGLPALPFVGSIPFFPSGQLDHLVCKQLAERYGDVFSFYFGDSLVVVLNSYEAIQEAFVEHSIEFAGRPHYYTQKWFNPDRLGISEADYTPESKIFRQEALSILRDLGFGKLSFETKIQQEAVILADRLAVQAAQTSSAVDPSPLIAISVSNVTNVLVFGKRFDHDDQRCRETIAMLHEFLAAIMESIVLDLFPAMRFLPSVRKLIRKMAQFDCAYMKFIEEEMAEHKMRIEEEGNDESDLLSMYISRTGRQPLHELQMHYLARDLFAAGTETTSVSLQWAMMYMANHPDIQAKVQAEIDQEVPRSQAPCLADKVRLPFTDATVHEILRFSTVVPLSVARRTTEETRICGHIIPKDATIMPNLWSVHRDPEYWTNPDDFDPERFLEDGRLIKKQHLIPFSLGRRSCLAEALARQELFVFFTTILQRFEISPPEGVDKVSLDWKYGLSRGPQNVRLRLKVRG